MNITKINKNKQVSSPQSKSHLLISGNYQIEILYNILKKNPSLINAKDQKKETFLSYAIKRKNIEIAELLLTSPILDYTYQDQNGNSYLHLAVINQLESIIRTLLQKGINVNMQNNDGNTALHFAYNTGDIKFIGIIVESKADFTIKNKNGLIAEEINPGTYPEILDVNDNNQNNNNVNVTQNKNNTVTINLCVDNSNENSKEKEKDKDNNGTIINERGQINKSIRINWDNNNLTDNNMNNNNDNNININNNLNFNNTSNNTLNTVDNTLNNINNNINNDINDNNSQFENTSKIKLKYSLVNYSYSDEGENEGEMEENGIIEKQNIDIKENDQIEDRKNIRSSDLFDLASSVSYQEKVANATFINAHTIGEPQILSKKDSNESEDIVNINKTKESQNPGASLENDELNKIISNGINMSQISYQTMYENGRNMNISRVNNENGKVKSLDFKKENNVERNGQNIVFDYSTSINKDEGLYNNSEIVNKRESEGICNYDNNNTNDNQYNTFSPQPEFNKEFAFSPVTTLKEPLNNNNNNNINGSGISNFNSINVNINSISNNISNININKEIKEAKKNNNTIEENSTALKRSNALYGSNNDNNINNKTNKRHSYSNNGSSIDTNYIKSSPTKDNYIRKTNSNLSHASQNNINLKTNSKIDFNCPVNISQETINSSYQKIHNSLFKFLAEIRMEQYYEIMNSNGFDDIHLLINQTKTGMGIKDKQLKEAGINIPGDRAKILLRLQEKAGNFVFPVPKEVYYISQTNNIKNDRNINKLNDWLKTLKIEMYLDNFVKNGYHSIELMLLQMDSKNPLTDEILKDELGILKIGHRSRIINKLLEEAKSLNHKLKASMLYLGNNLTEKICDCSIF